MTSTPASRNARATTLAPRSWPSRPGFAITTRMLLMYVLQRGAQGWPSIRRVARSASGPTAQAQPPRGCRATMPCVELVIPVEGGEIWAEDTGGDATPLVLMH